MVPAFVRIILSGILAAQLLIVFTNVGVQNPWLKDLRIQLKRNNQLLERLESSLQSQLFTFPPPAEDLERIDRIKRLEEQALTELTAFRLYQEAGKRSRSPTAVVNVSSPECNAARRSQYGEDMDILERFFSVNSPSYQVDGFFVEMGALDGLLYSNSYFYEHCLGWSGLLIEGQPENVMRLFRNRVGPNVLRLGMAACDVDGGVMQFPEKGSAVSGSMSHMSDRHKNKFASYFGEGIVNVTCGPLAKYFKLLNVTHIDFFSLDVEGAELLVLKTVDWTQITVDVLMVELRASVEKNTEVMNFLSSVGYLKYNTTQRTRIKGPNMVFLPVDSPFLKYRPA